MTPETPIRPSAPLPATREEIRAYVRAHYALGLPGGSVRALLALIVFGGIWAWMWRSPDAEVPPYLRDLMFIVMGHYFAARHKSEREVGPPPLFLPKGSVRSVLVTGFVLLTGALAWQHRMVVHDAGHARLSHAGVTLIVVYGFLAGVVMTRLTGRGLPRAVEDVRATLSLAGGILLVLLIFGFVHVPETGPIHEIQRWALHYRIEDVLAAVVGFYFGSRS